MQLTRTFLIVLLFLASASGAFGEIIFVDDTLTADCSGSYDHVTRRCGGGGYRAFRTVKGAADIARAGDTVVIRAGVYNEQLAPKNSGTATAPVVFSNYPSEGVYITGGSLTPAIWVYQKNHIIIQGMIVTNVRRWLAVLGSQHITIQFNIFTNANDPGGSSKTGLFFQSSDYNIVRANIIDNSTQDNLAFVQSHHNLVEENRITRASHTLWAIKCGSYNVLRKNYFHNEHQKIGEIYDCDEVGYGDDGYPKVSSLDDTKYNVVENNVFAYTPSSGDASPYAGIQHAGQRCIIRGNIFYQCIGPPVDLTLYADEARHNYGNRIYNNIFYDNRFGGVSISGLTASGFVFADNIFRNNIFYRNRFERHDTRWEWYSTLDGKGVQIMTGRTSDVKFERNTIFDTWGSFTWLIAHGSRTSSTNPQPQLLDWWENNYPAMFSRNQMVDPMFVDTAEKNFRLKPGSPLLDAAMFLARTKGVGSGTTMKVDDAGYFRDSYGIDGLGGDTIQLEGVSTTAVIVGINYATNTLTLDTPLEWGDNQGVSLKYHGTGPDVGAIENEPGPSSVHREPPAGEVTIAPNPTNGLCTVIYPERRGAAQSIRVVNMLGEVVHEERGPAAEGVGRYIIDLSDHPAGAYLLVLEGDGGVITRRFVKR